MARRIMTALLVAVVGLVVAPVVAHAAYNVSGTKFEDFDADGTLDAGVDTGIGGVTIYFDEDGDNVFDAGEPSAVTAGDGTYTINSADNNPNTVREVLPASYTCSIGTIGNFATCELVVDGPPAVTGANFGNFRTATISGNKFDDLDADGVDDGAGEPGISGVTIYIDANANNTFDGGETSTTTDGSGNWSFTGLRPGTYTIREVLPAGYQCSAPSMTFANCEFTETLVSNENDSAGQDFGNFQTASISGTKFHDIDGDGVDDGAGEPGLENVTIYLDANGNDTFDGGETSTTTDASGNWSFTGLLPGSYTVREVLPTGYFCSAPSFTFANCEFTETLDSGENDNTGQDFGNFQQASISGTKFEDFDADGVDDGAGDPGLSGVTIYIDTNGNDAFDGGESSTTTDGDGNWSFTGLNPGSYTIREVLPTGYFCSAPSMTFANCEFTETLDSGESDTSGQDFGNFQQASISGTKFEDLDRGGSSDGGTDPAISGVTIYLDANGNDTFDGGETSTTTDTNGAWSFTGLTPGDYAVREVLPAGFSCSAPSSDFANCEFNETLVSGESDTGNEFGNWTTASISGTKFDDLDADGTSDGGTDPGLSGVTIYLDANGNDTLDGGETSTTTDGSGNWSFTGLNPGTHTVREVLPAGYSCSTPGGGTFANCEFTEFLSSSENDNTGQNFGNFATATLSGTKFDDLDGDGVDDGAGEGGVSGVTIYLDANGNNVLDGGETSTTTDGSGNWSFTGLNPGTYTVREVPPAGTACTAPSTNFANCEFTETLTSNETDATGQDFGNALTVSISGTKFDDANGDGVKDVAEGPVAGVVVYLDENGNNALDGGETSNTTDVAGNWSFAGLAPGTHTVREVPPAGTTCTAPSSTFAACEFTETLAPGANSSTGHDFGNFTTPTGGGGGGGTTTTPPSGTSGAIMGTSGPDQITGTSGDDVILAGAGNDKVNGGGGDDRIVGGPGKDVLKGGAGNDKLLGQGGLDSLFGQSGKDVLKGGSGADKCSGGGGKDKGGSCASSKGIP